MNQSPEEKAKELRLRFYQYVGDWTTTSKPWEEPEAIYEPDMRNGRAKECAKICVDQFLESFSEKRHGLLYKHTREYWQQVKTAIDNL